MTASWPIGANDVRSALKYQPTQGNEDELRLYAQAACDLIDQRTGRDSEPDRHQLPDGSLPAVFVLAARETAKLWWQQSFFGPAAPSAGPPGGGEQAPSGPPMGAELPRKVEGWLRGYPPGPGIG